MFVEHAIPLMFELAEENALRPEEVRGDDLLSYQFETQQEAFEIVQDYIDTDCGSTMGRYTREETAEALKVIYDLGSDNILDEDLCDGDDDLLDQRNLQLYARDAMCDHITNHFGED
jgi:hypothetical protein